jgi:deoxycytidylate deaminase
MSTAKDLKWLEMAIVGGQKFSTCTNRQFMAIILDVDGIEVGTGWNGSPSGMPHCTDGGCPRSILHENVPLGGIGRGASYDNCVAVHAEGNALLHSDWTRRKNGTIYVGGPPCWDCAKLIANSGLIRVVCLSDPSAPMWNQTKAFLVDVGIEVVEVELVELDAS